MNYWPPNLVFSSGSTVTANTVPSMTISGAGLARSWSLMRSHVGPGRWRWTASGPKGSDSGWALSEAVARVRALRAYEELA